ncbi:hypothetical protein IU485_00325 [Nocardia cyriacigeorgica]|nr:hypothetical protein [Nocardia cyriacigeorgica]
MSSFSTEAANCVEVRFAVSRCSCGTASTCVRRGSIRFGSL